MKIETNEINGLMIFVPTIFPDERGRFMETFKEKSLLSSGIKFVQDNQSTSKRNVIRGLHYQDDPMQQSKLVSCVYGEIYDVAVDLRVKSPTYGKHFGIILSEENAKQLLIPKGFAHGFSVLSEKAIVNYKVSEYYSSDHDRAIYALDTSLGIDWKIDVEKAIMSPKDKSAKSFDMSITL